MPRLFKPRIYLASSWRNPQQPAAVEQLRAAGYEVYDFRLPEPGNHGFAWSAIDADWRNWTPHQFSLHLRKNQVAAEGFALDRAALDQCDACVLLLPCGRSAHLELGYAIGEGKRTAIVLAEEGFEPELMYLLADQISLDMEEVIEWLAYEAWGE